MRRPVRFAALVLPLLLLLAVGVLSAQPAEIRAVNLLQGSGPIDLFIADTMQPRIMNLEAGSASFVMGLPPGAVSVIGTPSGQRNQQILNTSVNMVAGERINLLLLGAASAVDAVQLGYPQQGPASADSVYIRIYHASPNLPTVNYTIITPGAPDVAIPANFYKGVTGFVGMARGTVRLKITGTGAGSAVTYADVFTNIAGGTYATLLISGPASDLKVRLLAENNGGPQQPMMALTPMPVAPAGKARLRLVNVMGGVNQARIAPEGSATVIVGSVDYRGASRFGEVDAGAQTLSVSTADAPTPATPLAATLDADKFYTVFWAGTSSAARTMLDVFSAPVATPGDSVDIRVVNASYGGSFSTARLQDAYFERYQMTPSAEGFSETVRLPAGQIVLFVRDADTNGADYQATTTLTGGTAVDLVLSGQYGSASFAAAVLRRYDTTVQPLLPLLKEIGSGALRIVNVAPPPPADSLSIYLVGSNEEPLQVRYLAAGPMSDAIPAMPFHLTVSANNGPQSAPILDLPIGIRTDTASTWAILRGTGSAPLQAIELTQSDANVPVAGFFTLRFVNASPDAGAIDIELRSNSGTLKSENVAYGSATAFNQHGAGTITVRITRNGTAAELANLEGTIEPGGIINAFVTGMVADNTLGVRLDNEVRESGADPMPALMPSAAAVPGVVAGGRSSLIVMPNPASRTAAISRSSIPSDAVAVIVLDPLGVEIASIPLGRDAVAGDVQLPVEGLASGCYGVQLRRADGSIAGATRVVLVR